ncbi:uncharacterized protein DSM5745_07905 [Aspergillus mulundensis]|uniref:Uncharacterized protein n=1 Tax=Aspergillus mulundensis TaxID=1810919 RepID=A0A3D8RFB0_9EURO|nr:hypothetical protein DSM5745_07905 [Aspergillus mulundensis]RDW72733.1 hypothetical protein DSM5745_07905 [Aspergillus mulundensis]
MERLPLEVFTNIIEQAADGNPHRDTLNARLVDREWDRVATKALITSQRLEIHGLQIWDRVSWEHNRFVNLPQEWKIRYLESKVKSFKNKPCNLSRWITEMQDIAAANGQDETEVFQQLIEATTNTKAAPRLLLFDENTPETRLAPGQTETDFKAQIEYIKTRGLSRNDFHVWNLWPRPFEPLATTLTILQGYHAIHHGDATKLASLLAAGHDVTKRSFRFRIWALPGETGTVANTDVAAVLVKHGAPLIFTGTTYTVNKEYLGRYTRTRNTRGCRGAIKRLRKSFRGLLWRVLGYAIREDQGRPLELRKARFINALKAELEVERLYMCRDLHPDTVEIAHEYGTLDHWLEGWGEIPSWF